MGASGQLLALARATGRLGREPSWRRNGSGARMGTWVLEQGGGGEGEGEGGGGPVFCAGAQAGQRGRGSREHSSGESSCPHPLTKVLLLWGCFSRPALRSFQPLSHQPRAPSSFLVFLVPLPPAHSPLPLPHLLILLTGVSCKAGSRWS